jgi:hypothetical protein
MDVNIAFLNTLIEEEFFINQPRGFEMKGNETHVCKLNKALYELKHEPCAWYSRIDVYLLNLGFNMESLLHPHLYLFSLWLVMIGLVQIIYATPTSLGQQNRKRRIVSIISYGFCNY